MPRRIQYLTQSFFFLTNRDNISKKKVYNLFFTKIGFTCLNVQLTANCSIMKSSSYVTISNYNHLELIYDFGQLEAVKLYSFQRIKLFGQQKTFFTQFKTLCWIKHKIFSKVFSKGQIIFSISFLCKIERCCNWINKLFAL